MSLAKLTLPLLLILALLTGYSAFAAALGADGDQAGFYAAQRVPANLDFDNRISIRAARIELAQLSPQKPDTRFENYKQLPDEQAALLKIYHPDMTRTMKDRYQEVEKSQKVVENPYRFARTWERQAEIDKRQEMAQWTAREVVNDRLKNLLRGADQSSAPLKMARAARALMGGEMGGEDKQPVEQASAPRKGLKPTAEQQKAQQAAAQAAAQAPPVEVAAVQEPQIPTKLRYKMNLLKGQGEVNFTNSVVNTNINIDVRNPVDNSSLDTSDRLRATMNKRISALRLDSSVAYALNKRVVGVNLSKQLTDRISCNVTSSRYTDSKRNAAGERSNQTANVVYSVSF